MIIEQLLKLLSQLSGDGVSVDDDDDDDDDVYDDDYDDDKWE